MSCEKHKRQIEKYDGSLEELANNIGDLHYESLREFFGYLSEKIYEDSQKDTDNGRIKLGSTLYDLSVNIKDSYEISDVAWEICKPYMK